MGSIAAFECLRQRDSVMKTAAVICHARFLDLAAFEETLQASGYQFRYYDAGCDAFTLTRSTGTWSSCSEGR